MFTWLKKFLKEEDGLGTVEMVLLVAVLVAIALIFGRTIKGWVISLISTVTGGADSAVDELTN